MSRFLLDTYILSLLQRRHPVVTANVAAQQSADIEVSVITLQEQMEGFQNGLRQAKSNAQTAAVYHVFVNDWFPQWTRFRILPFPEPAILRFEQLKALRLNVGSNDLRIAATALLASLIVVTRNRRDFGRVPGVVIQDWSV